MPWSSGGPRQCATTTRHSEGVMWRTSGSPSPVCPSSCTESDLAQKEKLWRTQTRECELACGTIRYMYLLVLFLVERIFWLYVVVMGASELLSSGLSLLFASSSTILLVVVQCAIIVSSANRRTLYGYEYRSVTFAVHYW